jgi:hypothetical protein
MDSFAIFLSYAACVFVLICVHESGHYLAGRLGGISSGDMRIRLFRFPQHVVLRDNDKWVSPTTDTGTYVNLVWQYLKTTPKVYLYVSGGIALETVAVILASVILILSGLPKYALGIIAMSWCLLVPWLIIDTIMVARGRIFGDFSGLWRLAAVPTALIIAAMIAVRAALMWWAGGMQT